MISFFFNIIVFSVGIYFILLDLPSIIDGTFTFPLRFKDMNIGLGVILIIYSLFQFLKNKLESKDTSI